MDERQNQKKNGENMNYDFLFLLLSDNLGILYIFAR